MNTNQMEALVWLGPRAMEVRTVPLPVLNPGEVLIEVNIAGICGSELSGYLGHNSLRKPPLIMGHEAAGRIVQVTEGTLADGRAAQVGMRVTFNPLVICGECDRCQAGYTNLCRRRQLIGAHRPGAFAQFVSVPAAQCYALPDSLSEVQAALTEPFACSVRAVKLSQIKPGQRLLILGAGPIGLFCLAVARTLGVEHIIVSDMSSSRLAIAQRWGAQEIINVRECDVLTTIESLAPGGVDAVIDAVGAAATREQAIQAVLPGGHVVFIGLHDETFTMPANYLIRQEITITGCFGYTIADFEHALNLLIQGKLAGDADWLMEYPLAEGAEAFAALVAAEIAATKVLLRIR